MAKLRALTGASLTILSLLMLASLSPRPNADALKKDSKKIAKAVVKNIVLRKLTTQHRILPMPVPLPGKWKTIMSIVESGHKIRKNEKKFGFKLSDNNENVLSSKHRDYSYLASDLRKFVKAINDGKIVATNDKSRNSFILSKYSLPSSLSSSSSSSSNGKRQHNKNHDPLVMMYNIYKFASRSIKDDVLGENALILNKLYHDYNNPIAQPPMISLNINNKKTLMNKLNYFYKPTDRHTTKVLLG